MRLLFLLLFSATVFTGCAFHRITRKKDITYTAAGSPPQQLNVFAPRSRRRPHPVLLFIHGGNWTSGRKELYNWFGSRLARKGIVAVIIDYPLSPAARWNEMAADAAQSVAWTRQNIAAFGGDPRRIYISGHSAGGHLAALVAADTTLLRTAGTVSDALSGVVLIDAAGLDMYGYLKNEGGLNEEPSYAVTFTLDSSEWRAATPLYHLHKGLPPFLIFRGGRTYPSIIRSNEKFLTALRALGMQPLYLLEPHKKHIPMITQFFNTGNRRYRDIRQFINGNGR